MPPMKIQPIDSPTYRESIQNDTAKPVVKSRLKRFFDRPFPSVLRISSAVEKPNAAGTGIELPYEKDGGAVTEFEPSSVCLGQMVQNFIEENNEKPSTAKCGLNRCNCFNGNTNDSSDDEFDGFADSVTNSSFGDFSDTLKSLIPCASVAERNLLADTSKIVEKNKACKRKDDLRKIVTDELSKLGYNASICKSKWEKTSSVPAGEYEYIDVIVEGERVLVDVDFRSEFEIARSTGSYKAVLLSLPFIFVGKSDRLLQIVSIVSEAARLSLKKKGMHIAPWRKAEYIKSKWLSPHTRIIDTAAVAQAGAEKTATGTDGVAEAQAGDESEVKEEEEELAEAAEIKEISDSEFGELELIFGEKTPSSASLESSSNETTSATLLTSPLPVKFSGSEEEKPVKPLMMTWQPPALKPRSCDRGNKVVVTGLASLLREKP
ncbi:uncharacterized protein [Nicotiana tomentosiformis]|uniref:uncharacterized protein n=1 Tax=Nicotiana tomentosiformis TaxID=4098 RepID=UPI00051C0C38|nr:uncharacterized protein LOC104088953 [Nicotiana tomentosiformis]